MSDHRRAVHGRGRRATIGAAALLAVAVAALVGAPASAATDGNWWYSAYHLQNAHDAGWTGKGVKVAVIDNQIDPDLPAFTGTNLTVSKKTGCYEGSAVNTDPVQGTNNQNDTAHGSEVTALIIGNGTGPGAVEGVAPDADVTFYGYGVKDLSQCEPDVQGDDPYGIELKRAINDGAKIITTSVGPNDFSADIAVDVAWALSKGVILLAAPPDSNDPLDKEYYGANSTDDLNGVVSVEALDSSGHLMTDDDGVTPDVAQDPVVAAAGVGIASAVSGGVGDGTSYATPIVAGMLAAAWQKFPTATNNQMIQLLIHTANPAGGTTTFGYGAASLTNMLNGNPLSYPDVNPLMNKSSGQPSQADVNKEIKQEQAAKTAKPKAAHNSHASGISDSGLLIVSSVVWLLFIAAAIVVPIVLVSRRRRRKALASTMPAYGAYPQPGHQPPPPGGFTPPDH